MSEPYPAPKFRIRVADTRTSPLVALPMQTPKGSGYLVERFDVDLVLPSLGEAVFSRLYGNINGRNYGAPELLGKKHVIIERDVAGPADAAPVWQIEFWGFVLGEQRQERPGSDYPAGSVQYHCKSGLWLLTQGRMDLHQWSYLVDSTNPSRGHPGYNRTTMGAQLLGNQDSRSAGRFFIPGHFYSAPWLDSDVVDDCLASWRYPSWTGTISLANIELLKGSRVYQVDDTMRPMDVLRQVFDRSALAALASLRVADTVGDTLTDLNPTLTIYPTEYATIEYVRPSDGAAQTLNGADVAGTAVSLDFVGRPEIADDDYAETLVDNTDFDAVETIGDRLQMVVTSKPSPKWTSDEETAFDVWRTDNPEVLGNGDPRYADVYARVGWGNGGPLEARDRSDNSGSIDVDVDGNTAALIWPTDFTSNAQVVALVDDLPLQVGYDYWTSSIITGRDADETGEADLVPWQAFEEMSAGYYRDITDALNAGIGRGLADNDVVISGSALVRPLESVDLDNLRLTVCIELPNRLRLIGGDTTGRVKIVDASGSKLVLADTGAILALDYDDASGDAFAPLYPSVNPITLTDPTRTFYRLRDDRDRLAAIHAQALAHHTTQRRTVEFTIRGAYGPRWLNSIRCGFLIHVITANGENKTINTPITAIRYDARRNETRVITDYAERRWNV